MLLNRNVSSGRLVPPLLFLFLAAGPLGSSSAQEVALVPNTGQLTATPVPPAGSGTETIGPAKLMRLAAQLRSDVPDDRSEALRLVDRISSPSQNVIDLLRQSLGPGNDAFRLEVMARLQRFGNKAAGCSGELSALAKPGNATEIRLAAIESLVAVAPQEASTGKLLIDLLQDKDSVITSMAALECGQIGRVAEPAVPYLLKLLPARDYPACIAFEALGNIQLARSPQSVDSALSIITSGNDDVMQTSAAFITLQRSGTSVSSMEALMKAVRRPEIFTRYAAAKGLLPYIGLNPDPLKAILGALDASGSEDPAGMLISSQLWEYPDSLAPVCLPAVQFGLAGRAKATRIVSAKLGANMGRFARPLVPLIVNDLKNEILSKQLDKASVGAFLEALEELQPLSQSDFAPLLPLLKTRGNLANPDLAAEVLLRTASIAVLPEGRNVEAPLLQLTIDSLRSKDSRRMTYAARLCGKLAHDAPRTVPEMIQILNYAGAKNGALFGTPPKSTSDHNLNEDELRENRILTTRTVILSLGRLGAQAKTAIPALQPFASAPSGATLRIFQADAIAALRQIDAVTASKYARRAAIVQMNQSAPNIEFSDIQGKNLSLAGWKGSPVLLFFVDTRCPCVRAYTGRVKALNEEFAGEGIKIAYIFPTARETREDIAAFDKEEHPAALLVKDEKQALIRTFDAQRTMEAVLMDREGYVRYRGRIDDNIYEPKLVKDKPLERAIQAVIDHRPVHESSIRPASCPLGDN